MCGFAYFLGTLYTRFQLISKPDYPSAPSSVIINFLVNWYIFKKYAVSFTLLFSRKHKISNNLKILLIARTAKSE